MALTFKKPAPSPDVHKQLAILCFPGETRKAILSGKRFGIYSPRTKIEWQYQLDEDQMVTGFSRDGPIEIGYLHFIEDNSLHYHSTRVDNPDWTSLNIIFRQNWELLEVGCRLKPGVEWRFYETPYIGGD